jgi:AcrR family transcriptional regulator
MTMAGEPGLRERKKADLKRRIADTCLALIRERGYDATTIEEIVRRVDVSQPTFYKYFASKDAILREYALQGFGELLAREMTRKGPIVTRMRRYLRAMAEQMTADAPVWYAIAVSNAYNPVRDPGLLTSASAGTRVLEAIMQEGQRTGELTVAFTARRLASMLEGILFRVCLEWGARFPADHSLAKSMDEAFAFFLRAAKA